LNHIPRDDEDARDGDDNDDDDDEYNDEYILSTEISQKASIQPRTLLSFAATYNHHDQLVNHR